MILPHHFKAVVQFKKHIFGLLPSIFGRLPLSTASASGSQDANTVECYDKAGRCQIPAPPFTLRQQATLGLQLMRLWDRISAIVGHLCCSCSTQCVLLPCWTTARVGKRLVLSGCTAGASVWGPVTAHSCCPALLHPALTALQILPHTLLLCFLLLLQGST